MQMRARRDNAMNRQSKRAEYQNHFPLKCQFTFFTQGKAFKPVFLFQPEYLCTGLNGIYFKPMDYKKYPLGTYHLFIKSITYILWMKEQIDFILQKSSL